MKYLARVIKSMIKSFFFSAVISLFFASHANAWDMGTYVENAQAGDGIETDSTWKPRETQTAKTDLSMRTGVQEDKLKHHSISVTYGILTLSDFAAMHISAFTELFSLGHEELPVSMYGAFSINYGYKFNEVVETGIIFNYAHPFEKGSFYTIMPKLKLNCNYDGFVNPFVELNAGIIFSDFLPDIFPAFHITFIGIEIGRTFPITLGILGFGQQGVAYAGLGYRF